MTPTPSQEERREALIERIGYICDLAHAKPLEGELGDVAYDLLRQAAAQISSDRQRLPEALDPPTFPVSEEKQGVTGAPLRGQALLASLPEPVPVSALPGDDPSREEI